MLSVCKVSMCCKRTLERMRAHAHTHTHSVPSLPLKHAEIMTCCCLHRHGSLCSRNHPPSRQSSYARDRPKHMQKRLPIWIWSRSRVRAQLCLYCMRVFFFYLHESMSVRTCLSVSRRSRVSARESFRGNAGRNKQPRRHLASPAAASAATASAAAMAACASLTCSCALSSCACLQTQQGLAVELLTNARG